MSPQQEQTEKASSENTQQNDSCNNNGVSSATTGVISEGEQCESPPPPPAVATAVEHDNIMYSSDGPSSIDDDATTKPLAADEIVNGDISAAFNAPSEEPQPTTHKYGGEALSDTHCANTATTAEAHVEPNNNKDGEEEARAEEDGGELFLQYSQLEQSISSNSLVQLEEHLKQPVLMEDPHHDNGGKESVQVEASSSHPNSEATNNDEAVETKEESPAAKIDTEKNHEKANTTIENVNGGVVEGDAESSSTQSSQKSNDDKDDVSNNQEARTTTTTTFISQDRVDNNNILPMSMSPSLTPPNPNHFQQQNNHFSSPFPHHHHHQGNNNSNVISSPSRITYASPPGRRTIKLRLVEEIPSSLPSPSSSSSSRNLKTPFKHFGRIRSLSLTGSLTFPYLNEDKSKGTPPPTTVRHDPNASSSTTKMLVMDRGTITVSWYDGTTSSEMQEHVFGCVLRKLNLNGGERGGIKLEDVRLLDENVEPHEGK